MLKFLSPDRGSASEPYSYRSRAKLINTGQVITDLEDVTEDDIVVLGRIHEKEHVNKFRKLNISFIHDICDNKYLPTDDPGAQAKLLSLWRHTNQFALTITTTCDELKEYIQTKVDKPIFVIPDPTERDEEPVKFLFNNQIEMIYYGSWGNYEQLDLNKYKFKDTSLKIITNQSKHHTFDTRKLIKWNFQTQGDLVRQSDIVLLPVNNDFEMSKYKGNNRPVDAIRQGRFVITNATTKSWLKLKDFMWCGDIEEGFKWAINNPVQVKEKITLGQKYVRENYSVDVISKKWLEVYNVCHTRNFR